MKSLKMTEVTGSLSDYARKGMSETVVVTKHGRPVLALMPLTKNDDWESASLSTNPRFLAIIERPRVSARTQGTLSLEEVRLTHGLPTKSPRRRQAKRR
jgi:antitoxin (DNA-binding transcriptional repressor) of toxin-antitoxin stability system